MKTGHIIGNYEYTNTHMLAAGVGFVALMGYGLIRRKGIGSSLILGIAGSLAGLGTAILIQAPKRID